MHAGCPEEPEATVPSRPLLLARAVIEAQPPAASPHPRMGLRLNQQPLQQYGQRLCRWVHTGSCHYCGFSVGGDPSLAGLALPTRNPRGLAGTATAWWSLVFMRKPFLECAQNQGDAKFLEGFGERLKRADMQMS